MVNFQSFIDLISRKTVTFSLYVNRRLKVAERITQYAPNIVRSVALLYGNGDRSGAPLQLWAARVTATSGTGFIFILLAAALLQDIAVLWLGVFLIVIVPFIMWRDLQRKIKDRHRAFVTELPVFVHKMSLLIGAGETVQGAWVRASAPSGKHLSNPLYRELERMRNELSQSVPFGRALELFSQRCGIPETGFLVTTTLMNYKRGGDAFAVILQQTGRTMIEKKRAVIKTMGEEATTKMVFPMVIIFAAMMCVVSAPAVMLMGNTL